MNIEEFRKVIEKRANLHPEDDFNTEKCWEEELNILCKNVDETIEFINNEMSESELSWIDEVFESLFERTNNNQRLIDALYKACEKYPGESEKYNVKQDLDLILKNQNN